MKKLKIRVSGGGTASNAPSPPALSLAQPPSRHTPKLVLKAPAKKGATTHTPTSVKAVGGGSRKRSRDEDDDDDDDDKDEDNEEDGSDGGEESDEEEEEEENSGDEGGRGDSGSSDENGNDSGDDSGDDSGENSGDDEDNKDGESDDGPPMDLDDEDDRNGGGSAKRRAKKRNVKDEAAEIHISEHELKEAMIQMVSKIRGHKDSTGRQLSSLFLQLPSKSRYPDYYEVIESPISLHQITGKINSGKYKTIDMLKSDIQLIFGNAQEYNMVGSEVYDDAGTLRNLFMKDYEAFNAKYRKLTPTVKANAKAESKQKPKPPPVAAQTSTPKLTLKLAPPKKEGTIKKQTSSSSTSGPSSAKKAKKEEEVDEPSGSTTTTPTSKSKSKSKKEGSKSSRAKMEVFPLADVIDEGFLKPHALDPDDELVKMTIKEAIEFLFSAIEENQIRNVDRAMKRGIDPNRNYAVTFLGKQYDFAPLHAAAFLGRSRILDILVTAGAKATMEDNMDKETPLFYACKAGHEGSAKRLLRMHADPVAKNRKGQIPLDLVPAEKSNPGWKTILTPKPPPPPPPPKPEPREKPQRVKPPPPASSQSAPKTPHDKRKEAPVSLDKSLSTPAALVKPEGLREKRVAPAPQTSARLERSATTPATPSVASRSIPPSTPTPVAHAGTRAATAASPSGTLAAQATSSAAAASSAMTPAMAARAAIAAQSAKMLSSHTPAQPTATPTPAPPPLRRPPSPPPDPRDPNQLIVPASIRSPEAKKAPPVYVNRLSLFTPEEQTERQLPVDPLKAHAITVRRHVRRVVIRLSLSPWIVDGPGLTAAVPSPGGLGTTGVPFGTFGGPAEGAMGMSRGIAGAIGSMSGMTAGSPMLGSGGAFYSVPQPQPQLQHPTMTVTPLGPLPQMMPNHLSMPAGAAAGPIQAGQQPLSGRPPSPSMDSTLYYSILCQHNRMPARPTPDFTARPRTASQPHIVAGFQQQQQQQPQQQQPQQAAGAAAASLQVLPHPPQQLVAIPADLVEGLNAFEISVSVFQKGGAIAGGGGGVLADLAAQAGISVTGSGGSGPDLFVPLDGCRQKFFVFVQRFS